MEGTTLINITTVYGFLGGVILFQIVLLCVLHKLLNAKREIAKLKENKAIFST